MYKKKWTVGIKRTVDQKPWTKNRFEMNKIYRTSGPEMWTKKRKMTKEKNTKTMQKQTLCQLLRK